MSELMNVLVADGVSETGLAPLLEDARLRVVRGGTGLDALRTDLASAHALIVRSGTRVDRELLEAAPVLKVVGRAGVGVDNIDIPAATERGVAVMNAPDGNTISAAELTFALILAAIRRIAAADRSVRAGEWKRSRFAGSELRGKTLGLVGAGRIGGEVARRAKAFGMDVMAADPYLTQERALELGVSRHSLEEVLQGADIVSLHVPLTETTRNLLGPVKLALLRPGAFLINVARGGVVDEAALADALREGRLAGAAVDVFETEPLPEDSPLLEAPNLVLTPHLGASTSEAQESVAAEISRAVGGALLRGDLRGALNAPAIGGEELQRLRPLLDLGRALGRLGTRLSPGPPEVVEVCYAGTSHESMEGLVAFVLMGVVESIVGPTDVNLVNAAHRAEQRGISVVRRALGRSTYYTDYVEVAITSDAGRTDVAGAVLGELHARLVRIDEYHVDVQPRGSLLVLRNHDVPGVIGKVGSLLGDAGLNIAEYHQARLSEGGQALAAIAVDGTVAREVVERLRALPEVADARVVELG